MKIVSLLNGPTQGGCRPRPFARGGCTRAFLFFLLVCVAGLGAPASGAKEWRVQSGGLITRWGTEVGPTNALPEYPRPQLVRADWINLNGLWDYAITPESVRKPDGFGGSILVPFPLESALSGVKTNLEESSKLWYRRSFLISKLWQGKRVRLHFGAVDWHCEVTINGSPVGQHNGGYDKFTFDITDALRSSGTNEIVVCVTDPTEGDQPRGKQSRKPEGIFYTSSSGIWQTVWLEPVPDTCIDRLKCTPDLDAKAIRLKVTANRFAGNLRIEALISSHGTNVATGAGAANGELAVNLPNAHRWTPDDPFLYDLKITLKDGDKVLDSVGSYFGMRKISLRKDDQDFTRIALNDEPIFQIGTLDQGFWPDGIYTAPTDDALRSDIEFMKKAGFNFTRKHVKVEPERWYYWCDKLGLLVWQDMPSGNNSTSEARRDFETELLRIVDGLENHPSLIVWVLFNEGWGQYDTKQLADLLRQRDPTRLVDNASGWTDMRAGDLVDMHSYPGPDSPAPELHRAAVLGEFGGFGLSVTNHQWSGRSWGYRMVADATELAQRYAQSLKQVWQLHRLRGLSAAVFTQTSDVETECNGLLTYDRAIGKIPPEVLLAANRGGQFNDPQKVILADGLFGRVSWKYTIQKPADDWYQPKFDASSWDDGVGGFGSTGTPGIFLNTIWSTQDIWLRREFTVTAEDISGMKLHVFHDEDVEVYLNGALAAQLTGFQTDYDDTEISQLARATLHPGKNTIAVHCHQTSGGQGVDVGIILPQLPGTQKQ